MLLMGEEEERLIALRSTAAFLSFEGILLPGRGELGECFQFGKKVERV
jgi:hypothetical protein